MMAMTAKGEEPLGSEHSYLAAASESTEMDSSSPASPSLITLGNNIAETDTRTQNNPLYNNPPIDSESVTINQRYHQHQYESFNSAGSNAYFDDGRRRSHPLPSGLSALIQAATSQLSHLAEVACSQESVVDSSFPKVEWRSQSEHTNRESSRDVESLHRLKYPQNNQNPTQITREIGHSPRVLTETTPSIGPETPPRRYTFPEILMHLALDPVNADIITFLPDGKYFAIRTDAFAEDLLPHNFYPPIQTYEEFLDVVKEWGFNTILDPSCTGISVFRHPNFLKGDWEKCSCIKFGESPTKVRLHALPDRHGIDYTLSDDSTILHYEQQQTLHKSHNSNNNHRLSLIAHENEKSNASNSKRRLSPTASQGRRESLTSLSSQKQRVGMTDNGDSDPVVTDAVATMPLSQSHRQESGDESELGDSILSCAAPSGSASYCNAHGDDVRSIALAITTEKLNIRQGGSRRNSFHDPKLVASLNDQDDEEDARKPLVERAVTSATHTIVTDAIETLLWDEFHTKETYLKHEKELSKSCIPGVIPISTQLFSPSASRRPTYASHNPVAAAMPGSKGEPPSEVAVHRAGLCSDSNRHLGESSHYRHQEGGLPTDSFDKGLPESLSATGDSSMRLTTPNSDFPVATVEMPTAQLVSSNRETVSIKIEGREQEKPCSKESAIDGQPPADSPSKEPEVPVSEATSASV